MIIINYFIINQCLENYVITITIIVLIIIIIIINVNKILREGDFFGSRVFDPKIYLKYGEKECLAFNKRQ